MDAPLYPDWQSRDVLLNLQPYLDAEPTLLDGFYPVTLQAYKRDDGYYGLPRDFQTIVLYYNKDMFDAAGVVYPTDDWTMDDLREAAKALGLPIAEVPDVEADDVIATYAKAALVTALSEAIFQVLVAARDAAPGQPAP